MTTLRWRAGSPSTLGGVPGNVKPGVGVCLDTPRTERSLVSSQQDGAALPGEFRTPRELRVQELANSSSIIIINNNIASVLDLILSTDVNETQTGVHACCCPAAHMQEVA